jgi:hypothetical protein
VPARLADPGFTFDPVEFGVDLAHHAAVFELAVVGGEVLV